MDGLTRAVREQIGRGADWIKVYADYRWGPGGETRPTFTARRAQAHRGGRAQLRPSGGRARVERRGDPPRRARGRRDDRARRRRARRRSSRSWRSRRSRSAPPSPPTTRSRATAAGSPGTDPEPAMIAAKRASFKAALAAGVTICMGGDVGVFPHGENWREMELLAAWGMTPIAVLRAATSVNARVFHIDDQVGTHHARPARRPRRRRRRSHRRTSPRCGR